MAKPIASDIILPSDGTNTGKKVRTQTRVVGSDTVHEHFQIPIRKDAILGVYFTPYNGVLVATAHSFGTSGFFWLINPVGSNVLVNLRRINMQSNNATALVTVTCPRIAFTRFSFTGTASGADQTPGKRKTADASPGASFRTAITGMTLTTQQDMFYFAPPMAMTAVAASPAAQEEFIPMDPDSLINLVEGEGICCWQADNGTTSDTRKIFVNLSWEEIDNT